MILWFDLPPCSHVWESAGHPMQLDTTHILYTIHHTNQNHPAAHKTKLKGHENQPGASQDFHCESYEMNFASAVDSSSGFCRCMEVCCKGAMCKNMLKISVMFCYPKPLLISDRGERKKYFIYISPKYGSTEVQMLNFLCLQSKHNDSVTG